MPCCFIYQFGINHIFELVLKLINPDESKYFYLFLLIFSLTLGLCVVAILLVLFVIAMYQTFVKNRHFFTSAVGPTSTTLNPMTQQNWIPKIRRDSELIAVIEEDVLKHAHRRVMLPLFYTRRRNHLPPLKVIQFLFETLQGSSIYDVTQFLILFDSSCPLCHTFFSNKASGLSSQNLDTLSTFVSDVIKGRLL